MKRYSTYISASSDIDLLSLARNLENVVVDIEIGEYGHSVSSTELDTLYEAVAILHNISRGTGVYDAVAATRK